MQRADNQCEIKTALLNIIFKLLNLKSLGVIWHIFEACCTVTVEIPKEGCAYNA